MGVLECGPGGWTLIPSAFLDKLTSKEQTPLYPILEDPLDEELVKYRDDDYQDFLIDDFVDEDNFLEDNIPFENKEIFVRWTRLLHNTMVELLTQLKEKWI